jgi:general secretion pathway protein I
MSPRRPAGFTLVEILVALAIVAIALTAGMRALTQASDTAGALKARTLALWIAQDRLATAQIATPWPALGSYTGETQQAGASFVWQATVSTTPNPAFRRIDIVVAEPQTPDYAIARLTGFLGNPEPRP